MKKLSACWRRDRVPARGPPEPFAARAMFRPSSTATGQPPIGHCDPFHRKPTKLIYDGGFIDDVCSEIDIQGVPMMSAWIPRDYQLRPGQGDMPIPTSISSASPRGRRVTVDWVPVQTSLQPGNLRRHLSAAARSSVVRHTVELSFPPMPFRILDLEAPDITESER